MNFRFASEIALIILGIFLIADSWFFHLLSFDYSKVGLSFLDNYINHWMIGLGLLAIGLLDYQLTKR